MTDPALTHSIQDHWITLDGARMRSLRCGVGPDLVLVHGLLGYSFSWRYAMTALSEQATVHAVDMLGVGFSDRPRGLDCSLQACGERLLRFLDESGLLSCDLLGTSHGGAVAMMAAALAPERVRRLILVAPANPWSAHGKRIAAFLTSRPIAPVFLQLAPWLKPMHGYFLRRLFGDARRVRPGTVEGYSAPFEEPRTFEYGLGILRTWDRDLQQLQSLLPRIAHIPVLLIWGQLDKAVDPASAGELQQQFSSCRLEIFEGVGHLPYEEAPERFNATVAQFLNQTPAAAI